MATKKIKVKLRYSIVLPRDVYQALKYRAVAEDSSVSAIVREILERRFGKPSSKPLPVGPAWTPDWVVATVFLPKGLLATAKKEAERQHGGSEDGRARASVRVIAGLVAAEVAKRAAA